MPADKELTEFINKALDTVPIPSPQPRRRPKRVIRYRWNLQGGGLTRIKEKEGNNVS